MIKIERVWAMPNKATFTIKPIAKLLERYVYKDEMWADPFAGFNSPALYTNDLNQAAPTSYHLEAEDFCRKMEPNLVGVLFDPPYSNRQISEHYREMGKKASQADTSAAFFSKVKDAIAPKVRIGGFAISFGWNSQGFGKVRGFEIVEILLVPHGGAHNDTIVVVETKVSEAEALRAPPKPEGSGIRAGDIL